MNAPPKIKVEENAHDMASENVLSYLLEVPDGWQKVFLEKGIRALHFPQNKHRALYNAIISLRREGKEPTDTIIIDRCQQAGVTLDYFAQLSTAFDPYLEHHIDNDLDVLHTHGVNKWLAVRLRSAVNDIAIRGYRAVIADLMTELSQLGHETTIKNETVPELVDVFSEYMTLPPQAMNLTGLEWFDQATGGVSASEELAHLWWIPAPYKSRKSTFMLNIALGIHAIHALNGTPEQAPSTAIMSREMGRLRVTAQLIAMLATNWIIANGYEREDDKHGYPINNISAYQLLKSRGNYRNWHELKREAVEEGKRLLKLIMQNVRIYDASPEGGGLSDFASLKARIERDKFLFGTQLVFADYFQLLNGGDGNGNESAELAAGAHMCQQIVKNQQLTMVMLAQQNEETVKGAKSYSAGIKGTGAAAATADFIFSTAYNTQDLPKDVMKVSLTHSRETEAGISTTFFIHPESGLMTEARWIERRKREILDGGKY